MGSCGSAAAGNRYPEQNYYPDVDVNSPRKSYPKAAADTADIRVDFQPSRRAPRPVGCEHDRYFDDRRVDEPRSRKPLPKAVSRQSPGGGHLGKRSRRYAATHVPRGLSYEEPRGRTLRDEIDSLISTYRVVVFSKTTCPHCDRAKRTLREWGITYRAVELDVRSDCQEAQDVLKKMTGARSVPRVFINGKCIGGNDDTQTLARSGDLRNLVFGSSRRHR